MNVLKKQKFQNMRFEKVSSINTLEHLVKFVNISIAVKIYGSKK